MLPLDISTDDFAATPLAYPGTAPGRGVLLMDRTCLDLRPRPGRGPGEAEVSGEDGGPHTLDAALLRADIAPVDQRTLVVSIGSNASLAVMRRKLSNGRVSTTLPVLQGSLGGIAVGHSAHVSVRGYFAAAPFASRGARTAVYASWLDDEQLGCLDETERNYLRLDIARDDRFRFTLGSVEDPHHHGADGFASVHLYVSSYGLVTPPGGTPVALGPQADLFRRLAADCEPFGALFGGVEPIAVAQRLAGDRGVREDVRRILADEGWSTSSQIPAPGATP